MSTKLTNEQSAEIAANPHQAIPVTEERSGKTYYIVDDEFLFGQIEKHDPSRARLQSLIEEGFASGEVTEEEAHDQMRAMIEEHRSKNA